MRRWNSFPNEKPNRDLTSTIDQGLSWFPNLISLVKVYIDHLNFACKQFTPSYYSADLFQTWSTNRTAGTI